MIWSPGRRYLFLHIPKTGGTSLALALESRAMKDDVMLGDTPKALRRRRRMKGVDAAGRLWKHSTLADLDGLIGAADLEGLFVVTMVRNPWDRLVSYYHWLQMQRFDHPAVRLARSLGFSEFLNHPDTRATIRANPVARYTTDAGGQDRLTHAIRLEHLDTDLAPFEAHLGFDIEMPHENRSDRPGDYHAAYSEADSKLVAELCAEDINRYGYRF